MTQLQYDEQMKRILSQVPTPDHRDDFYADLEVELAALPSESKITSFNKRYLYSTLTAAASVAVVIAVAAQSLNSAPPKSDVALPTTVPTAPTTAAPGSTVIENFQPTLVSVVLGKIAERYASIKTISGKMTYPDGLVTEFGSDNRGNSWSSETQQGNRLELRSFDAKTGEFIWVRYLIAADGSRTVETSATNPRQSVRDGVGGGFPISALLDGFELTENSSVEEVTYKDRPAWRIDAVSDTDIVGLGKLAPIGLNQITATFDKESLALLRLDARPRVTPENPNPTIYTTVVDDLKIDAPLSNARMNVRLPDGSKPPLGWDAGFERTTIERVRSFAKNANLLPTYTPDGFVAGAITLNRAWNWVEVPYYRGLDRYVYTLQLPTTDQTPPSMLGGALWNGIAQTSPERRIVEGGAFNGQPMLITTGFALTPNVVVQGASTTAIIGGDLSKDELVKVAQSIQSQ